VNEGESEVGRWVANGIIVAKICRVGKLMISSRCLCRYVSEQNKEALLMTKWFVVFVAKVERGMIYIEAETEEQAEQFAKSEFEQLDLEPVEVVVLGAKEAESIGLSGPTD
jgi:hypothetical protein